MPNEKASPSPGELLAELDEEILVVDGLDDALIGYTDSWVGSHGRVLRAVYSVRRSIEVLMEGGDMDAEAAQEYFDFNVAGAYMGPGTPVFVYDLPE